MILDRQLSLSDGQALTATAASTDVIDFGAVRQIGVGEPLYVVLNFAVGAGGTSPTMNVAFQTDDNSGFSSAATLFTSPTYAAAAMTAGTQYVYPLPVSGMERFFRLNYTLGGTSPTMTLDAHIVTQAQLNALYPSGFSIQ